MAKNETYRATVGKIIRDGPRGPYAVCHSAEFAGSVTFSLKPEVWKEKSYPDSGNFVIISDLRRNSAGWRTMKARFVRPQDEQEQ